MMKSDLKVTLREVNFVSTTADIRAADSKSNKLWSETKPLPR